MNPNSVPRFRLADDHQPQPDDRKPQPGTPVDTGDLRAALHDRAARRRLMAWLDTEMAGDTLLRRQNWPLGVAALLVVVVSTVLLWLAGAFVLALVDAAAAGGRHSGLWLRDDGLTRIVTDPVRAWLDAHTAGLPATGAELGLAWLVIAAVLYLAALGGSMYARIAWALTGAATIAAAYTGAPATGAAAAAGTTAALWLLLSLPVYRRRTRRPAPAAGNSTTR